MPQKINTKHYGEVIIEKSWCSGAQHIGKLVGGGYVYLTGLPVKSKGELKTVIPPGPDLDEALDYWDNPDKYVTQQPQRIMQNPDGSYEFEDATPVTTITELVQYFKEGPQLDAAVACFMETQKSKSRMVAATQTKAGAAAVKAKKTFPGKKNLIPARKGPAMAKKEVVQIPLEERLEAPAQQIMT